MVLVQLESGGSTSGGSARAILKHQHRSLMERTVEKTGEFCIAQ